MNTTFTENKVIRINSRGAFTILICLLWSFETLVRYVRIILGRVPYMGYVLYEFFPEILIIITALVATRYISRSIEAMDLLFSGSIMILSLATVLIDRPSNFFFKNYVVGLLTICIPLYFVGKTLVRRIHEGDDLIKLLVKISVLSIFLTIMVSLISGSLFEEEWMSNQYVPYILLPHLALITMSLFETVNLLKLFTVITGFIYVLFLGNRGSIVCYITYLLIIVIHKTASFKILNRLSIIIGTISVALILFYKNIYVSIIYYLSVYASNHGMSTRIFSFLKSGYNPNNFDSGRGVIQEKIIDAIRINPFGYGLASDVYISGTYSHNIIIELLVEFGVFIGSLLIFLLFYFFIRSLHASSTMWSLRRILWLFFCVSFVKLLISGTYLNDPYFFIFLGFLAGISKEKRVFTLNKERLDEN